MISSLLMDCLPNLHRVKPAFDAYNIFEEYVLLDIGFEEIGDCFVVSAKGELNAQSCTGLQTLLMDEISKGRNNVVIRLDELSFVASAGLRVLLIVARRMAATRGRVGFVEGSTEIMEVLEISGVKSLIPVFPSVTTAVEGKN